MSNFLLEHGHTRRLHDFASPRRKLRNDATCPPSGPWPHQIRPPVLRPKPVKPVILGFEAKPVKPSRTPPHDVTGSPVLRPNRSNHDVDACPTSRRALTPSSRLRAPAARAAYLTRHRPRRLGRRRLHHHVLLLFCAPCGPPHDSARPPRVPQSRPTRIHPSPSWSLGMNLSLHQAYSHPPFTVLVPRHEPFAPPSLLVSILHHGPSA